MTTFEFEFDPKYSLLLKPLGVGAANSFVAVGEDVFHAKFGRWEIKTPLSNIAGYERSGDYKWYKAIGVRGSLADRGLTFGSTTRHGVCVRFVETIPSIVPGLRRHSGLTVTVADASGLVAALEEHGIAG